jgi:hypothetical protein
LWKTLRLLIPWKYHAMSFLDLSHTRGGGVMYQSQSSSQLAVSIKENEVLG